ncbi:MAG: 4-(cytidine 5'-diphospho)-2-C-methyl-D-erythritol kinase [Bacteroidia bacterium]
MICFPNAKINLGLNITEKRADGFHNIETLFYPVQWRDSLECIENKSYKKGDDKMKLTLSGIGLGGNVQNNLVAKAYKLLDEKYELAPVKAHLHKAIPMGAGLGGGSADGAFFIKLLNEKFELKIPVKEQINFARQLGSDCAFFIENKPVFASEKGDVFAKAEVDLSKYFIVLVYPAVHSNTAEAYKGIVPAKPEEALTKVITGGIKTWKNKLVNDFEKNLFLRFPVLEKIKSDFYNAGAAYAAMSGSGSAMFGIFPKEIDVKQFNFPVNYLTWNS